MSLFEPSSIAVIGASATPGKVGHDIVRNLVEEGFAGAIYPINPKEKEILGKKSFASVKEIPGTIDLAIIVIPAKLVPAVLMECAEKKIENVVIISAGFGEVHTKEGDALEKQIRQITIDDRIANHQSPITLVGPNCLGILRTSHKMNASFATKLPPDGPVALISQSGAMAVAIMDASFTIGIGYSFVASIGNKTVMDECDFLERAASDDQTTVIGFYLESIKDGARFLRTATEVARKKHIVLLKAGTSQHGAQAAASHTGALAGSDAGIDALCAQSGIVRAHDTEEFLDLLQVLSNQPALRSPNIAIITNAGGPGILATDAAERAHLKMPPLGAAINAKLKTALPAAASTGNPIDLIGDAGTDRYVAALKAVGDEPDIDGVAVILTPQVMTPCEEIANAVIAWKKTHSMMPIVASFMGGASVSDARLMLQRSGVPCFDTPERAIHALGALRTPDDKSPPYTARTQDDSRAASAAQLLGDYTGLIPEDAVNELFALYGIPLPVQRLATSEEEAVQFAQEIGYPVIAKISAPSIIHKTDVGGIKAHLLNDGDVRNAYREIIANVQPHLPAPHAPPPNPHLRGVLIQQFLPAGNEFIVGATRDSSFGHLVMVGLGGIYTELLQDTAFRIAPIGHSEAYRMLSELTSWKLLLGMRGSAQLDIENVAKLVETVSQLVTDCPQIKDIDLNPVFVKEKSVIVADAKVVIG